MGTDTKTLARKDRNGNQKQFQCEDLEEAGVHREPVRMTQTGPKPRNRVLTKHIHKWNP